MKHTLRLLFVLPLLVGLALTGCIRKTDPQVSDSEKKLDHLVILEVFYVGSYFKTGESKPKDGKTEDIGYVDKRNKYLKIYNPTDKPLYLDGLALVTSALNSTEPIDFVDESQNFIDTHMAVSSVAYFPGTGTQYPIQPGEVKLITAWAGDYTKPVISAGGEELSKGNPESLDLSKADFQWLTEEQISDDIDRADYPVNTAIPFLLSAYPADEPKPFDVSHNQTIALVKWDKGELAEGKIAGHMKTYTLKVISSHRKTQEYTSLLIPNTAIIDAVTVSPTAEFTARPVGEKVDSGAFGVTASSATISDRSLLGKAMRRKHDGKKYVDDNNSTSDFEVVKPDVTTPKL